MPDNLPERCIHGIKTPCLQCISNKKNGAVGLPAERIVWSEERGGFFVRPIIPCVPFVIAGVPVRVDVDDVVVIQVYKKSDVAGELSRHQVFAGTAKVACDVVRTGGDK